MSWRGPNELSLVAGTPPSVPARIAVVVPFFQSAGTIARTVRSLQTQTMADWHAVLVDDGSTDPGQRIARELVDGDPRLVLLRKRNGGVASARNAGLPFVRAGWLHHLDADDWLEPGAYATLLAVAARGGLGGAMGSFRFATSDDDLIDERRLTDDPVDRGSLLADGPAWLPSMIVRARAARCVRFDESLTGYEDLDYLLRLAETGVRWSTTSRVVATYCIRPGSLSKRSEEMLACARCVLCAAGERAREDGCGALDRVIERTVRGLSVAYATRSVLLGGTLDGAAAMYRAGAGETRVSPRAAATAVVHGVMTGLGLPLGVARARRHEWLPAVEGWWRRIVAERWARQGFEVRASRWLAPRLVDAAEVCDELLRDATAAVTVIGYGRNGAALTALALARGLKVTVRDDRFDADPRCARDVLPGAVHEPMDAPFDPGRPAIVTPLRDGGLVKRLGRTAVHDRWRSAIQRLAFGRDPLPSAV